MLLVPPLPFGGDPLVPSPAGVEEAVMHAVLWLRVFVEAVGAIIVGVGIALAVYRFALAMVERKPSRFNGIRLLIARYLALALEFQLASDVLTTAIAPTWEQIGKLAAVAVIRTALNFFLMREMQEERREARAQEADREPDSEPTPLPEERG